jgi:hypothetical protein
MSRDTRNHVEIYSFAREVRLFLTAMYLSDNLALTAHASIECEILLTVTEVYTESVV